MLTQLHAMVHGKSVLTGFVIAVVFSMSLPLFAAAQTSELTVTPIVIDDKAKVRDILKKSVTITNSSNRKLNVYPVVNDVNVASGTETFISAQSGEDRADSLANWIEISRGVIDLSPGETREIPFVIRVNLNAIPNTYHADISFYEGSTLSEAQQRNPLAVVTVNTEVQADIKESMQLNKFITDNFFFSGDDVLFNYQLENIGNQSLVPKGEIRIYDRKGREVASVPVNPDGQSFTPEQAAQLASAWSAAEGFGKFKAFLNIDYGNNQSGSLQDTVFFWIIPWQQLLAMAIISIIAIVVSAIYFHRWLEHRHMQRFALAGMGAQGGVLAMPVPVGMLTPVAPIRTQIPALIPDAPHAVSQPEKKGYFARFKRARVPAAEESVPEHVAVASPAVAPIATPVRAATVSIHTEPEIHAAAPSAQQPASNTIDLTSTHMQAPVARNAGHVINLKGGA